MKYTTAYKKQILVLSLLFAGVTGSSIAQTTVAATGAMPKDVNYKTAAGAAVSISGTSTLHDWTMKSTEGNSTASFTVDADQKVIRINSLSFSVRGESILSEHTLMNDKTYEALKTKSYPNISFVTSGVSIVPANGNNFTAKSRGKLTIAGVSRDVEVNAACQFNQADRSITCTGSKKIKMTDYGVKPPAVMFNTIKTGDDITVDFNVKLNRQ
jgi:polyisoprenoid-binding protein YceI